MTNSATAPIGPEQLIAQLQNEETVEIAFEGLVLSGDAALPALTAALKQPQHDRGTILSVISALETEAAYKVLVNELRTTPDKGEQVGLVGMLVMDERLEILPWLKQQLPANWQSASWYKKNPDDDTDLIAASIAGLITLDSSTEYFEWLQEALEGNDPKLAEAAEYVAEFLIEEDEDEEE